MEKHFGYGLKEAIKRGEIKVGDKIKIPGSSSCWNSGEDFIKIVRIEKYEDNSFHQVVNSEGSQCSCGDINKDFILLVEEKQTTTEFKVGDRVKAINASHGWGEIKPGDVGTINEIDGCLFYVDFDTQDKWCAEEEDLILINKEPKKVGSIILNVMEKLSTMMKKLLSPELQTLAKAGYINSNLELTEKGIKALNTVMFLANQKELVTLAEADIAEAEKNKEYCC